jgi:hypothetical protein
MAFDDEVADLAEQVGVPRGRRGLDDLQRLGSHKIIQKPMPPVVRFLPQGDPRHDKTQELTRFLSL